MRLHRNLIPLLLILFLDTIASNILLPIVTQKFAIKDLGPDPIIQNFLLEANFGVLLTSSYVFFSPVIGFLSDIIGRNKIIKYCIISSCIGYCLIWLSLFNGWLFIFLLSLIILGIGSVLLPISLASLADINTGKKRIYTYALVISIMLFSIPVIWLSNYLITKINILFLALVPLVCDTISLLIALKLLTETYTTTNYFGNLSFVKLIRHALQLIRSKKFLLWVFLFIIFEFSWGIVEKYLASYVGFNDSRYYIFITYSHLIMIVGSLAILPLLLRFLKIPQLIPNSLMVAGIILIIFSFFSNQLLAWIITAPLMLSFGLFMPVCWYIFSNLATEKHRGLIMGIICPLWCLSWSMSDITLSTNLNFDKLPINLHFCLSGLLLLIGVLLIYRFKLATNSSK